MGLALEVFWLTTPSRRVNRGEVFHMIRSAPPPEDFGATGAFSIEVLDRIEVVCRAFEAAWKRGEERPQLEASIEGFSGAARTRLLWELLALELEYRVQRGDAPSSSEYLSRFPLDEVVVRAALSSLADPKGGDLAMPNAIGPYRLLERLGEGGMGTVFLAEQTQPIRRRVALKVIKLGMDTKDVAARFESERQALALMDHPGIAKVFDAGATEDGKPYFVMEYVQGAPITEYCDRNKLSIRKRLELFLQVCHAIEHAHHKEIIHRDIKPSNILVSVVDDTPLAKIIDFGVAKATNQVLTEKMIRTQVGCAVGTPAYMSPEQTETTAHGIDRRTDVYSLGVLLYEILVGELPLDWEALSKAASVEIRRRIREEDPPTPSTRWSRLNRERTTLLSTQRQAAPYGVAGALRGDLDWITMKALEKDRTRRYGSASELGADIQRHLHDEPVLAGPPSVLYRLKKHYRRHRVAVLAVTAVIGVLVAGLTATAVLYVWAMKERDQKVEALGKADEARLRLETNLIDLYTANGLRAHEAGNIPQAALWFANAALRSDSDPRRQTANRARVRSWLRQATIPVAVLADPGRIVSELAFHPAAGHLLVRREASQVSIWSLSEDRALSLPGSLQDATAAAWSPDGRLLALGDAEGNVNVLTFPDGGNPVGFSIPGPVQTLAFDHSGERLAAAGDHLRAWSLIQKAFITAEVELPATARDVVFDAAATRLAVSTRDNKMHVYVLDSKLEGVSTPLTLPFVQNFKEFSIPPVFVDHDSGVVAPSATGEVTWWDLSTGRPRHILPFNSRLGHRLFVRDVRASPSGRFVLIAGHAHAVIWDLEKPTVAGPSLRHDNEVVSISFSPDERFVLTGSWDNTARLWTLPDGEPYDQPIRHKNAVWRVAYSPDGLLFATAQEDGQVFVWSRPKGHPGERRLVGPGSPSLFAQSPDGGLVLPIGGSNRGSNLRSTQVHDLAQGRAVGRPLSPGGIILDASFSPDGSEIATASSWASEPAGRHFYMYHSDGKGGVIDVWNWRSGEREHDLTKLTVPSEPRSVRFHPDGHRLVVSCATGDVLVIDIANSRTLWQVKLHDLRLGAQHYVSNGKARFSPDGKSVLCWGFDASVSVLDSDTGNARYPPLLHENTHEPKCHDVEFSRDGVLLVTCGFDRTARVWDLASGQPVAPPLAHPDLVFTARFSDDQSMLVTACRDHFARLWDWRKQRLLAPPMEHAHEVMDVAFLGIGDLASVVTASHDGSARVWDIRNGLPLTPELAYGGMAWQVAPVLASASIVVGGANNHVMVCPLDDLKPDDTWTLTDLLRLSEVVSFRSIQDNGGIGVLDAVEWRERWKNLRGRHPEVLGFEGTRQQLARWHEREALASEVIHRAQAAKWHLHRFLAREPKALWPLVALTRMHLNLQEWDSAATMASAAIALDAGNVDALEMRARARLAFGDSEPSIIDLTAAIALRPGDTFLWSQRAAAMASAGRLEEASQDVRRSLELGNRQPITWSLGALLALARGETMQYRETCQRMLEVFPEPLSHPVANSLLMTCSWGPDSVSDLAPIEKRARTLVERHPAIQEYRTTLGAVLCRVGKPAEAIRVLSEGISQDVGKVSSSENALVFLFLSLAHVMQKEPLVAKEWLKKVREEVASQPADAVPGAWFPRMQREVVEGELDRLLGQVTGKESEKGSP